MNESYEVYLKSDHWKYLRKQAIERWGDRCSNCSIPDVDVHHLRYGNLIDVTTDDLMPLCRRCHEAVHLSPGIKLLWDSNSPSQEKRLTTKAFLAGRDEVLRAKTEEVDKFKEEMKEAARKRDYGNGKVYLNYYEVRFVNLDRREYNWLKVAGFKPNTGKWKKKIIGIPLPASIFGRYKIG